MALTGLIVIGSVVVALTANPAIIGSMFGAGLALKTFSETKNFKRKIETSTFAYAAYQKVLLDLRTAAVVFPHWWQNLKNNTGNNSFPIQQILHMPPSKKNKMADVSVRIVLLVSWPTLSKIYFQ